MSRFNISFAGAGRVGASLCTQLHNSGCHIDIVHTRSEKSGGQLAQAVGARWSSLPEYPGSTDVVIVSVPDNSLEDVLKNLKCSSNTVVAHTAGSYGLEVFPDTIKKNGVFYPLQTFSESRVIDLTKVPFLLEAGDKESAIVLSELASLLSRNVSFAGIRERRQLHLAAVFACNFANHMMAIGTDIAIEAGLNPDILKPLISETVQKALEAGPTVSQTGPAIRNDMNTIDKHLKLLDSRKGIQKIYETVTQSIIDYYKGTKQ